MGVGAMLMFNEQTASPLKGKLFPAISSIQSAGVHHFLVLIALGLAYCYIASAPILTMHAFRAQIDFGSKRWFTVWSAYFLGSFLIVFLAVLSALPPLGGWRLLAIGFVCLVVAFQFALFFDTLGNRGKRLTSYYWSLSGARAAPASQVQEYVESYRHLREHGNAFAIIISEFGFALAAISVPSVSLLAVLLVLWVLPAAGVWFVGTVLEAKLANAAR